MMVGRIAFTTLGLIAFTIAMAAACAAILTGFILSATAESVGARSTARYGSTFAEIVECCAMARMDSKARSRAPASFLFESCFFSASTTLHKVCQQSLKISASRLPILRPK